METNKPAQGSRFLNFFMAFCALIGAAATIGSFVLVWWIWHYPTPAHSPSIGEGVLMSGYWWQTVILSASLLIFVGAQIAIARIIGKKRRAAEISRAEAAESALGKCQTDLAQITAEVVATRKEAGDANKRANDEKNSKDETYNLLHARERQISQYAWLMNMANEQRRDLSAHVEVTSVHPRSVKLTDLRCVTVTLHITNLSVFDITINPKHVAGHFSFNGKPYRDPVFDVTETRYRVLNLKPRAKGIVTIEQPLLETETEAIRYRLKDATAEFWLGGLIIPITIENLHGPPINLRIGVELESVLLSTFLIKDGE